jgi:hypothetical protein
VLTAIVLAAAMQAGPVANPFEQILQVCDAAQRAVHANEAMPPAQRRTAEDILRQYLQGQSPEGQRICIAYLRGYVAGATAASQAAGR